MPKARNITAKFAVSHVSPPQNGEIRAVLSPDYQDGRNKEWAKYTPAGSIDLTMKEELAPHFTQGQAFTVTFTPED